MFVVLQISGSAKIYCYCHKLITKQSFNTSNCFLKRNACLVYLVERVYTRMFSFGKIMAARCTSFSKIFKACLFTRDLTCLFHFDKLTGRSMNLIMY